MILKCHKSYYACKFNLKGVSYQMYLNLFQTALNIEDPWFIKNIEFAHESNQLDIWIDFKVGSKFDCPICNKPGCTAYDLSLIHISEPTRLGMISYAVFCWKKKKVA